MSETSSLVPGSSFGCSSLHIESASQQECQIAMYSLKTSACNQKRLHVDKLCFGLCLTLEACLALRPM